MKVSLGPGSGSFEEAVDVTHHECVTPPGLPVARSTMVMGWAQYGACVKAQPDTLFVRGRAQHAAKKVCLGCSVIVECLADSLDNHTEFGVWGGMTERQRRVLLKRWPQVESWRAMFEADRERLQRDAGRLRLRLEGRRSDPGAVNGPA